jgi:predicted metal-dependent enzyme (double-stranded beta helix superfamily)
MTTALAPNPALATLVADLDDVARHASPSATVDAVAATLRPHLGRPDLLKPDQRVGDPAGYRQHLLHVAPDGAWSLVALVWLPGQATAVHDHVTWCVVGVHAGYEHETRYRLVGPSAEGPASGHLVLVEDGTLVSGPGSVVGLLPPGDIHRVENSGHDTAISLHVYGADLRLRTTSIRRRYDLPVRARR